MERNIQYSDEPDQPLFFRFPFIDNFFAGGGGGRRNNICKKVLFLSH